MKLIKVESTDLAYNLALEEYFVRNSTEEFFMLWQAKDSILLGVNQNAFAEINVEFVENNHIQVVRRMSGGGAVYNDLGNTNFCFISNGGMNDISDFKKFASPILEVLIQMGVNASFSGRNDLTIDGKKFSGNAQYKIKQRMLHHGTLLFSSDIVTLTQSLNPSEAKFDDKTVKSVRSRVTNIKDHLNDDMDIYEFKNVIYEYVSKKYDCDFYELTSYDKEQIEIIANEKYRTWDWNFGKKHTFAYKIEKKFLGGLIDMNLDVKNGKISEIKFFGDFFGNKSISEIENAFVGRDLNKDDISHVLDNFEIGEFMFNITKEDILELFKGVING
jgi:lipoate-protein ligase A